MGSALSVSSENPAITVTAPSDLILSSGFSVAGWVNSSTPTANANQTIISQWDPLTTFTTFSFFDAGGTDSLTTKGYIGAISDGRYIYYAPYHNGTWHANVLRYDTNAPFGSATSYAGYNAASTDGLTVGGYTGGVFDGRYIYFAPLVTGGGVTSHAVVLQYDTQSNFKTASSWHAYDAASTDSLTTKGYAGAAFDGRYVYFAPRNNEGGGNGNILRYDTTAPFRTSSSWSAYNASSTDGLVTKGYGGVTFDGRYLYFVPQSSDAVLGISWGTDKHERVLRYDTQSPFKTASSWSAYDAGSTSGLTLNGSAVATTDGRYVYFSPKWNTNHLRYDTQGSFKSASSWLAYNSGDTGAPGFDGRNLQLVPYDRYDTRTTFNSATGRSRMGSGYVPSTWTAYTWGAGTFDGRYFYPAPYANGDETIWSGVTMQTDTTLSQGSFQLSYSAQNNNGSMPASPRFLLNTSNGTVTVRSGVTPLAEGWHYITGTFDGSTAKLYVDGALTSSKTVTGTLASSTNDITIGSIAGGTSYTTGLVDEVQLYTRALTDAEVLAIYNQDGNGLCKVDKTSWLKRISSSYLASIGNIFEKIFLLLGIVKR